jgi:DnaJ-class molecular chaperone
MKIKCIRCYGRGIETGIDDMGELYQKCMDCNGEGDIEE